MPSENEVSRAWIQLAGFVASADEIALASARLFSTHFNFIKTAVLLPDREEGVTALLYERGSPGKGN